jgi:hypothetical protein
MDDGLQALLDTLERREQTKALMQSMLNKPTRVGINSIGSNEAREQFFSYFTQSLTRPALNVKGIQLLKANIPQANASFGDYELCFWYYRLRTQTTVEGYTKYCELPNVKNLYCCRLLPSWYKPELISTPNSYGFNKTFQDYQDLADELAKCTQNDLAYDNDPAHSFPFIPGDISLTFNDRLQKIQMTGNKIHTDFSAPYWNVDTIYPKDFVVSLDVAPDSFFIAVVQNQGESPVESFSWQPYGMGTGTITNTYYIAPPDDPNIQILGGEQYLETWNPYHIWDLGDVVFWNGNWWISVTTNQGSEPAIGNRDWNPSLAAPMRLGVKGLSQRWDFDLLSAIPPQPSLSTRNLALRLGFTWRDTEKLTTALITPEEYPVGSNAAKIFNRLRPVPIYAMIPEDVDLSMGVPYPGFVTGTLTADSWPNLVRSSVIYIYMPIVGTATLDTQRLNAMLAIAPMPCGSLGVGFSGDSVDNRIELGGIDLNFLSLDFRDEAGEPYMFPGNAVITAELKLFY